MKYLIRDLLLIFAMSLATLGFCWLVSVLCANGW